MNDFWFYQKDFQKNPKAAKRLLSVGEKPRDSKQPTAQLAAYTLLANTLLNLDEAVMQN